MIAHYFTHNLTLKSTLLGFSEVEGYHTGTNLAASIAKVCASHSLSAHQIGFFVLDNASNNDTALEALFISYLGPFLLYRAKEMASSIWLRC
jgi:hypothetical protein